MIADGATDEKTWNPEFHNPIIYTDESSTRLYDHFNNLYVESFSLSGNRVRNALIILFLKR